MEVINRFFRSLVMIQVVLWTISCNFNFKYKIGNGHVVTEEKKVEPFTKLIVGGSYKVTLEQADRSTVIIKTDENLIGHIRVENMGEELFIGNIKNLKGSQGISINVFYRTLDQLISTGSSSIRNKGSIDGDRFEVDMSGSGSFEGMLDVEIFVLNLSGAGLVQTTGYAGKQTINISGAGGYQGFDLRSEDCNVTLSGVGGAKVNASNKLTATITGLGGIVYKGDPEVIERRITGMGKISREEGSHPDRSL
jgi:hypothetical protein